MFMSDPIFVTIKFGGSGRSGRQIRSAIQRITRYSEWTVLGGIALMWETPGNFTDFRIGQMSYNECNNVILGPPVDDHVLNMSRHYTEVVVMHHVWDGRYVAHREYPFNTTEDQLIAGVNMFARELVDDDRDASFEALPFQHKPVVSTLT